MKFFSRLIRLIHRKINILISYIYSRFGSDLTYINKYKNYDEYINFQKQKSTNPNNIDKWMNDESAIKTEGFSEIFNRNHFWLNKKKNAICLGSRTGQEVKVLLDKGINAIGVDIVPFPPYTDLGDIHNLKYKSKTFDLIFTNIMDHSINPEKFCQEMERIAISGAIIIINLQLWTRGDKYTESIIYDSKSIIDMFKSVDIKINKKITNVHDSMNWELVLEKL